MVARDYKGELIAATTKCKEGHIAPNLAEALGIKEALSWIKDKLHQPVIMETDCLTVVQAIRCSSVHLSYLGRVMEVNTIDKCPVCNAAAETAYHVLVSCTFAQQCWHMAGINVEDNSSSSFNMWINAAFQRCSIKELQEIFMICWSPWKNRNEVVWNQRGGESSDVCKSAKLMLNQWKNAQDKSFDNFLGFMHQEDGKERWEHPQEGMVKINVDAAIFETSSTYCLSMVARDYKGELIAATTKCKEGHIAPNLAEALGIKEALSWIKDKLHQPVIMETDCLTVVQAIRCSSVHLSYLGRVIEEIKAMMSDLQNRLVTLNFVKRSANKVADRIWSRDYVYPELHFVLHNNLIA